MKMSQISNKVSVPLAADCTSIFVVLASVGNFQVTTHAQSTLDVPKRATWLKISMIKDGGQIDSVILIKSA